MESNPKEVLPDKNRSKKPYQEPQLQVYGDLRDITQNMGPGKTMDGGKGKGNDKTSP
jgi:hypothetical protein